MYPDKSEKANVHRTLTPSTHPVSQNTFAIPIQASVKLLQRGCQGKLKGAAANAVSDFNALKIMKIIGNNARNVTRDKIR